MMAISTAVITSPAGDEQGQTLGITEYADRIQAQTREKVREILESNPEAKIVIEAPEWEGLLSDYFSQINHPRVLKVSRIHTPLTVTSQWSGTKIARESEEGRQIVKEYQQMRHSDLLSAPTSYVLDATFKAAPMTFEPKVPYTVIPNMIDVNGFVNSSCGGGGGGDRDGAIELFHEITACEIDAANYNIFVIGSVETRKGVEIVVDAVEGIVHSIPNAHVYFIGHHIKESGNSLTSNKKLLPRDVKDRVPEEMRSHVHFTDYVNHAFLPKLMPAGDVFPICYLGDNFPATVAEIGLSRRPMIAYLKGGIPEMIRNDTGQYLVRTIPGDLDAKEAAKALVSAITEIKNAANPEQQFQSDANAFCIHLQTKFHPMIVAVRMLDAYATALSQKTFASPQQPSSLHEQKSPSNRAYCCTKDCDDILHLPDSSAFLFTNAMDNPVH